MAASDSPPIGLSHPTVNPNSKTTASTQGQTDDCMCNDCDYTVTVDADLPPTCPNCGGALLRVIHD